MASTSGMRLFGRQLSPRFLSKTTMFQSTIGSIRCLSTRYTSQHEYATAVGNRATIGITDFAQNQLGDVVYVDLPSVGDAFEKGDAFGSVESVKAASDVYMPAGGEVVAINEALAERPQLVNEAAMTDGWFIKINMSDPTDLTELMPEEAYQEFCETEDH